MALDPSAGGLPGAAELAARLRAGELTAVEAVERALARLDARPAPADSVVWRRDADALREAREADRRLAAGEPAGPLDGVPITVKESFDLAGAPTTAGLEARRSHRAAADGVLVERLRAAGAIVVCKTNVAQLLVYHETDNPLYGRSSNPWDPERTPGGSSGGEAAVLAAGAACLGLGSDIGGSVRVPAHFCGVAAIKPTALRLTLRGSINPLVGLEAVQDAPGPFGRTAADLALALRVLAGPAGGPGPGGDSGDHRCPPVPLGDPAEVDPGSLRVGFWEDDGWFRPSPAVRRAVRAAARALRSGGARVEPFAPPAVEHAAALYFGLAGADGGAQWRRMLRGSSADRRGALPGRVGRVPRPLLRAGGALARRAGQRELALLGEHWGRRSTDAYMRLRAERDEYVHAFVRAMDEAGLDALLCPPYPLPALRHGASFDLGPVWTAPLLFNLLGMPAGVVPVTRVRPYEESDRPRSRRIPEIVARRVERGSIGLPVGVQVAARHWREDVVLAALGAIERGLDQAAR